MESAQPSSRVLVVAHKTAATQPLLDAVRERAAEGPATFTLLVPNSAHGLHKVVDAEDQDANEAQAVLDQALPKLSEAAGAPVEGMIGDADPSAAVQDAINLRGFDEVIISTLSPETLALAAPRPAQQGLRARPAGEHRHAGGRAPLSAAAARALARRARRWSGAAAEFG